MNKFKHLILLFLIVIGGAYAGYGQNIEKKVQVSVSTGQEHEDFRWSIAGNSYGQSPNILSELKWENVSGQNYAVSLQWNVWRHFSLFGSYNRQNIKSGSVNDMDYSADNRVQPTYTGNFSDNKGYTSFWLAGTGYILINNRLFSLVPYAGYSNSMQNLYLVDLTGQFPDLNSSYDAKWEGIFLKVISSLKIWRGLKLRADITYNQVNYSANGDWNLINEFKHPVSYSHAAKGYGANADVRIIYAIIPHLALSIGYAWFNWETGNGNDQLYLTSGQVDKTQLNGVVRNGFQINGGMVFSF